MPDQREALKVLDGLEDHDVAEIARRIIHDPRIRHKEGLRGWWYRWAGSIAFAAMLLITAAGLFYVQHVANQSNGALCALRADLQSRVAQTQQFLQNPEDFPQFSDPNTVALIQQQVEGQKQTIEALGGLPCS